MPSPADDNAVAVIGLAFELPRCTGWDDLTEILRSGTSCIGPMPPARAAATGVTVSDEDRHAAWLADIAGFDHRYFGLSRAEAELIDPRQRGMLRLAVMAMADAGYSPAELRGQDVAVLVAAFGGPHPTLYDLLPDDDRANGLAFTGSMHAYAAGRIAYHLDLRGPAMVIDTSCSSFLVALHEARWKLVRGETGLAVVGGLTLLLGAPPQRTATGEGLGVLSPADRCSPFDAAADGTALGEGGGFVVLKRLADAVRDGDTVHAVIRGSAVNQDAGRSNGLTAPSPVAQAQVVSAAWRDAAVDPTTIGYLEAHGTGTRIGDPIEIQGLATANAELPGTRVVSSVKGNVGHLGAMAGFAGLVRVIAQFRVGEIFPTALFRTPNPLLEVADLPLRIADRNEQWAATTPRRAGISGFGLSGTNAHLVVEEGPTAGPVPAPAGDHVVVLSARTEPGLRHVTSRLRARVAADAAGFDLAAAADVLALGREHWPVRLGWVVRDTDDLLGRLDSRHDPGTGPPPPLALGFGAHPGVNPTTLSTLAEAYPGFAKTVTSARGYTPADRWSTAQRCIVWLVGLHAVLKDFGVAADLVLAHGTGAIAARVVREAIDLATALAECDRDSHPTGMPDVNRLRSAIAERAPGATVLDLAPGSALSTVLATLSTHPPPAPATQAGSGVQVVEGGTVEEVLAALHVGGWALDWRSGLRRRPRRRIELPVAPLADEPCWPAGLSAARPTQPGGPAWPTGPGPAESTAPAEHAGPGVPAPGDAGEAADGRGTEETVLDLARAVLKEPGLSAEDDFFDRGGNSLNGTQLITRINQRFGTDLGVLDLFDHPNLAALARAIDKAADSDGDGATAGIRHQWGADEVWRATLSGQQLSIWSAIQLAPASGAYNLPGAFLLGTEPDVDRLTATLEALVRRHEMLRCSLLDSPGHPAQVVHPPESVRVVLQRREMELTGTTSTGGRPLLLAWLGELAAEPLSPYGRPPVRFQLVRARFADRDQHVLLLTVHHLFFDGWSWRIVLAELENGVPGGPAPARRYADHIHEQRAMLADERGRRLTRFWSEYLGGGRPVPLPTDDAPLSSSALSMTGAHLPLPIRPDLAAGLRRVARAERVTLQMVLLAAWKALLWKISGERDIGVGTPVAGRQPADEDVVGNYVNMIVVRVRLRPEEPFGVLLTTVRDASLTAHAHRDLPSDHILRAARLVDSVPLATSVLNVQSGFSPLHRLDGHGPAEFLDVDTDGAKFPLNLAVLEYGTELQARLKYASGLFHRETVRAWLNDYDDLLHRIVELGGAATLFALFRSAEHTGSSRPPAFRF